MATSATGQPELPPGVARRAAGAAVAEGAADAQEAHGGQAGARRLQLAVQHGRERASGQEAHGDRHDHVRAVSVGFGGAESVHVRRRSSLISCGRAGSMCMYCRGLSDGGTAAMVCEVYLGF